MTVERLNRWFFGIMDVTTKQTDWDDIIIDSCNAILQQLS